MSKRVALPEAIKAIREAKAATSPDEYLGSRFCIRMGMSHGALVNIEAGRRKPSQEAIHRIAATLGVSVDAISYVIEDDMEAVA